MPMFVIRPLRKMGAGLSQKIKKRFTPAAVARVVEPILSKSFLERFDRFSDGGGDWKKLKPETIRRKKSSRILFHTGDLRNALKLGLRAKVMWVGSIMRIESSVKSTRRHKPSKLPMQKLITIHHYGTRTIPARKILVRPRPDTGRSVQRAIVAMMRTRR